MIGMKSERQATRLQYIDLYAYIMGEVNRNVLMDRFDVKQAAASNDFNAYKELAGHNLVYDHKRKAYVATDCFSPYFNHEVNDAIDLIANGEQRLVCVPKIEKNSFSKLQLMHQPKLDVVAPIFRATNLKRQVDITYVSMTSGKSVRTISPHSLFVTNSGTYCRAKDHKTNEFRNFKLNRILESKKVTYNSYKYKTEIDKDWNTFIQVEIGINQNGLDKDAIVMEYCLDTESKRRVVMLNKPLLLHFLQEWHIAPLGEDDLPSLYFPLKVISILEE
ncbi:WYL domain-containing protein [Glaciecola sp. 33A]|uniref:WYL domain-containing protein n=1 Tax=Glaciecola sp. 33A TaxID=2057807 RepID=UPI0012FF317A|nr:WYL domain-containing protein [Glaciecola sp. 33A]